MASCLFI